MNPTDRAAVGRAAHRTERRIPVAPGALRRCVRIGFLATLCVALSLPALGASFYGLGGDGEAPGNATDTFAFGMMPDGSEIVGRVDTAPGPAAFVYGEATRRLEVHPIELPGGAFFSAAVDRIPTTGGSQRLTLGHSEATSARRIWLEALDLSTQGTNSIVVPPHPAVGVDMLARGVGQNEHVYFEAGGTAWSYDPNTSFFEEMPHEVLRDVDLSGQRVVGSFVNPNNGQSEALLWDEVRGNFALGTLAGGDQSIAYGISADGRTVVGASNSSNTGDAEAFRWHPDLGMHALRPIVNGGLESEALATSEENSVVGAYQVGGGTEAFLWTPLLGRVDLRQHLIVNYGLAQLNNWVLIEATRISTNGRIIAGNGLNPEGNPEAWVVDLDGPDIAELRLRPIDPTNSPSHWELYLECGDLPVRDLYFGMILPSTFNPDDFYNFGDCADDTVNPDGLACTGSGALGPNVSENSFVTNPFIDGSSPFQRPDALYVRLIGAGGSNGITLCEPGEEEVFLAPFLLQQGIPELVRSAFDSSNGLMVDGVTPLPDASLAFLREIAAPEGADLRLVPDLNEAGGNRWNVTLESESEFGCFSFGIIMPPGESGSVFGNCVTVENGGSFNERSCSTTTDISPNVDADAVRTIGPSPNLAGSGLRTDTLYVYTRGALTQPVNFPLMNVSNQKTALGVLNLNSGLPTGFGRVPTLTYEGVPQLNSVWTDFTDWCDEDGVSTISFAQVSGTGITPVGDSDVDGDGVATSVDVCPYIPDPFQDDVGTLEQVNAQGTEVVPADENDRIGDLCQCGDVNGSFTVLETDILALRTALVDPSQAGAIMDAHKCNSVGPALPGVIDSTTGLPADCNLNDVYALLKARASEGPLIPPGNDLVSCPDVYEPPE